MPERGVYTEALELTRATHDEQWLPSVLENLGRRRSSSRRRSAPSGVLGKVSDCCVGSSFLDGRCSAGP